MVLDSSVSFTEKDVSKFVTSCGTMSIRRAFRLESVRSMRTFCGTVINMISLLGGLAIWT
jgi:hypothetical protein